ncbi:MAG: hypothetical protein VR70_14375, partial [Rhodospirillaceae bacterium BRH_c57]
QAWLVVATLGGLVAAGGFAAVPVVLVPPVSGHAYAAVTAFAGAYMVFHAGLGAVFTGYAFARGRAGWLSAMRMVEVRAAVIWWVYTAAAGGVTLAVVHLLPRVAQS